MNDQISIAMTDDGALRVYTAVTTQLVNRAHDLHHTTPLATAALGRVLTGGAMMGAMQKEERTSLTIQIKGNGPLGPILAVADGSCRVRGYVSNPDVTLPLRTDGKLDVGGGVGKSGYLSVVRDTGSGTPYTGQVELVSGEIAEDLTYYYAISEQVPTAMALGVLVDVDYTVKAAGGYLVQLMPGKGANDDRLIDMIEQKCKTLPPVTRLIAEGATADDLVGTLLGDVPHSRLGSRTPVYQCNCSRERTERMLISIGAKDLKSLTDVPEGTEVTCSFCDKAYHFSVEQLNELLKQCTK